MLNQSNPKVTMLAEMPGGTFQKMDLRVTSEGLEHRRKRHLYDNTEQCIFTVSEPCQLERYEQIAELPEPANVAIPDKRIAIGEYDNMFPYSTHVVSSWHDIEIRQERREVLMQVGLNRASDTNARNALENPLANALIVAAAAVAALMVMIVATAFLFQIFGKQEAAPSALLPVLLGAAFAVGKRKKRRHWSQWTVYLFDTVNREIRTYSLPFSEIIANVPQSEWRFPVISHYKLMGALLLPLLLILVIAMLIKVAPYYIVWEVAAGFILLLPFLIIGWKLGPWFAKEAFWWCRPYVKFYYGEDANGEPVIEPVRYTNLVGVDPVIWTQIVEQRQAAIMEEAQELGMTEMPQSNPIINRASDAWNSLYSPLYKEWGNRIPWSLAQKLQVGSLAILILGTIGLSFFIIMALSD